jgi:1-acyl-sn-glycerol-3-phosphate acyltransferase
VLDDPLIWAACFSWTDLARACISKHSELKRWTLGAEEICFTNPLYRALMHSGRVIPVRRGEGIGQPAVDLAIDRLCRGDWVHVFVEGRIGLTPGRLDVPIRWGIGRLVMESTPPPIIVPIVHLGLERVVGLGRRVPRRAVVDVRVGPIIDGGMLQQALLSGPSDLLRSAVALYLQERLSELYILNNPSVDWFKHEQVNI